MPPARYSGQVSACVPRYSCPRELVTHQPCDASAPTRQKKSCSENTTGTMMFMCRSSWLTLRGAASSLRISRVSRPVYITTPYTASTLRSVAPRSSTLSATMGATVGASVAESKLAPDAVRCMSTRTSRALLAVLLPSLPGPVAAPSPRPSSPPSTPPSTRPSTPPPRLWLAPHVPGVASSTPPPAGLSASSSAYAMLPSNSYSRGLGASAVMTESANVSARSLASIAA